MLVLRGYSKWVGYGLLMLGVFIILGPFLWIMMQSFKYEIDILRGAWIFKPTLFNYNDVLWSRRSDFLSNVTNSAIVAAISTFFVLIVGTLAAYSLARLQWQRWISAAFLGWTLIFNMIPPLTLVGPWYLIFRELGLSASLTGVILTHITLHLPMTIWMMMAYFSDLPKDIEEAAMVDGCRRIDAFWKISLPLVTPGLIAAGVLAFVFSWNEFSIALNLTSRATATVPVAIARFAEQYEVQYGQMAAASVLSTIPALILMFFGQRFVVQGLTMGAVK
ncbi:carbohydrate ABC transporter permease [Rhizobium sp. SSA_523]|uniref:carbohydrate ABC transporter permease n=1 Tax=Rhizobium sp. SSA_523 TaxID=2952477 RepID=UPI002091B1AE|nr:carbohydrate ABC transporter permease [Rhizobium sp. SSA_523]MCO5734170.1 carbohydrate ABC transporter permease [Rhizobium sp. SSA_523]WKC21549.1 carbohydrate ABC transporter permease [Rhizobium sp. SSA_523]